MNEVFRPYLPKFILVFFDNILVCSHSGNEHLEQIFITGNSSKKLALRREVKMYFLGGSNWNT